MDWHEWVPRNLQNNYTLVVGIFPAVVQIHQRVQRTTQWLVLLIPGVLMQSYELY